MNLRVAQTGVDFLRRSEIICSSSLRLPHGGLPFTDIVRVKNIEIIGDKFNSAKSTPVLVNTLHRT